VSHHDFSLAEIFRVVEKLVQAAPNTEAGMRSLVDECSRMRPHPDWGHFRRLPYAAGAQEVVTWLADTLRRSPPPARVDGLWFGLFNPVYDDGTASDLYVCGNPYSPTNGDWACAPHLWKPGTPYSKSELLKAVYRAAYGGDDPLENDAEYPICLCFAALAVRDSLRALDPASKARQCAVFVGFDDGDFVEVSGPRGRASSRSIA
jgi:hypothetical protein